MSNADPAPELRRELYDRYLELEYYDHMLLGGACFELRPCEHLLSLMRRLAVHLEQR